MAALLTSYDAFEAEHPDLSPPLLLGRPEGEGWVRLADLGSAGSVALAEALRAMADVRGYPDPITIGASFALITTGGPATQIYRAAMGHPVPVLDPRTTWWRIKPSANVTAVAVEECSVSIEPERLDEALHLSLDSLYAEIHRQTRFPIRAQWSMLASTIGYGLVSLMADDHERAVELLDSLLANDTVLSGSRPRVTWWDDGGRRRAFTTRRVCCFNYRGRNGHYCSSQCPIVPAEDRLASAIEQMRPADGRKRRP